MKRVTNLLGAILFVILITILDREIGEKQEKPMQKKHTGKWMLFCILALALLGLMNKCVLGQEVPVFYAGLDPHIRGQTVCNKDNQVAILVNNNVDEKDTASLRVIINHELVHIEQMKKIGDCVLASKDYAKDPLAKEIPAYCEELKERMVKGDAIDVLAQFVNHMTNIYGKKMKLSYGDVLKKTEKLCLDRRKDEPP